MKNVNMKDIKDMSLFDAVDSLGYIKSELANLAKLEKALVAKLKKKGGRIEGTLFEANTFESKRETVNWKAIAEKVGFSPQMKAGNTRYTNMVTLKVTARSVLAKAA